MTAPDRPAADKPFKRHQHGDRRRIALVYIASPLCCVNGFLKRPRTRWPVREIPALKYFNRGFVTLLSAWGWSYLRRTR